MSWLVHSWKRRGALLLLCTLTQCSDSAAPDIASRTSDDPGTVDASGVDAAGVDIGSGAPATSNAVADATAPSFEPDVDLAPPFPIVTNLAGASDASELFAAISSLCWLDETRTQISCSGARPIGGAASYAAPISDETTVSVDLGAVVDTIALGRSHACALLDTVEPEAQVVCWGNNDVGQLGVGDTVARPPSSPEALLPVDLGSDAIVLSLAAGENSTCALLDGGTFKCWGSLIFPGLLTQPIGDGPGEMGDALPVVDVGEHAVRRLTPSLGGMCFSFDDDTLACSGLNTHGQLGQGDTLNRVGDPAQFPSEVDLGSDASLTGVFGGYESYCALLDTGRRGDVKCWGNNTSGQLALGDTADRGDMPAEMGAALQFAKLGDGRVSDLALGDSHACALFDDQRVKCWGKMILGDGTNQVPQYGATADTIGDAIPDYHFGGKVPEQIASGLWFTCVRFDAGDFACWGRWMPMLNVR